MPDKIAFRYANSEHSFSSVSELRDALLGSYPGAAYLGSPIVLINRDDPAPAWGWLVELLKTRTDWWPALGVALQHAAQDGGDNARIALADFLDTYQESVVLLEWTEPIASQWPDVRAGLSGTTFGHPDHRLATIVVGQRRLWDGQQSAKVEIEGLGPGGTYLAVDVNSAADLETLLAKSAAAGNPEVRATLDWFFEQHDLWRHLDLLDTWTRTPPIWWNQPSDKKPPRWRHPIRTQASSAKTLGEVALSVLTRARAQAATRPTVDLAPIFGGRPA